ncbi:MAG: DUF1273 domain-containing protein [Bacillota bacterium]|nr:DUF1273 domain-containing protein [Bacillota bacterium]
MKITITGHRPERIKGHEKEIYEWFKKKFAELRPSEVITGMAQGVDQIAASAARDMKIPYLCVYPYRKKSFSFQENELFQNAAGVIYLSEKFYYGCYHARDKFMVDRANKILVVWDGKVGGGTYFTMNYAINKKKEMEIFRIDE